MTLHYLHSDGPYLSTLLTGTVPESNECVLAQYTESGDALIAGINPSGFWRLPRGTTVGQMIECESRWGRQLTAVAAGRDSYVVAKYVDNIERHTDMWLCSGATADKYCLMRCVRRMAVSHLGIAMTDDSTTAYLSSRWFPRYPHIEVCDLATDRLTQLTYTDFYPGRLTVRHGVLYMIDVGANNVCAVDCRAPAEPIMFARTGYKVSAINPGLFDGTLLLHGRDAAAWYDLRACAEYEHESATYKTLSRAYV